MSRYNNIDSEITEMKELITAVNKRFDQIHKKINIIDQKVNEGFNEVNQKLDVIIKNLNKKP